MKTLLHYFLGLLFAAGLFAGSLSPARAVDVGINVGIAPPPLPVAVQPDCPGAGYIWTPGYWAWDPGVSQYYWVPGTWVISPSFGLLWTPAWWGCDNGFYNFHSGYWGSRVGFYGGINYGYGYFGRGYSGGYWRGHNFYYNREVNNVRALAAARTYDRSVAAAERNNSRLSFNGPGGTTARATAAERAAVQNRVAATSAQRAQVRAAQGDPAMRFSNNHGTPAVTGNARAGELRASTAAAQTPAERNAATANERTAAERSATARTARSTDGAFTGEPRTASTHRTESHVANTEQRASRSATAESSLTGERNAAASERAARSTAIQRESALQRACV